MAWDTSIANACDFQPRLFSRQEAHHLRVPWPRSDLTYARRFSSVPPSAAAKRPEPSKHSGNQPRLPQGLRLPGNEQSVSSRMPAVARYPAPLEVCRREVQVLPTSKKPMSPRANSTRSAVRCIIYVNMLVLIAWSCSAFKQKCVFEGCN